MHDQGAQCSFGEVGIKSLLSPSPHHQIRALWVPMFHHPSQHPHSSAASQDARRILVLLIRGLNIWG
jgi:hypothetical protein